jgi:hypothetical protein
MRFTFALAAVALLSSAIAAPDGSYYLTINIIAREPSVAATNAELMDFGKCRSAAANAEPMDLDKRGEAATNGETMDLDKREGAASNAEPMDLDKRGGRATNAEPINLDNRGDAATNAEPMDLDKRRVRVHELSTTRKAFRLLYYIGRVVKKTGDEICRCRQVKKDVDVLKFLPNLLRNGTR